MREFLDNPGQDTKQHHSIERYACDKAYIRRKRFHSTARISILYTMKNRLPVTKMVDFAIEKAIPFKNSTIMHIILR